MEHAIENLALDDPEPLMIALERLARLAWNDDQVSIHPVLKSFSSLNVLILYSQFTLDLQQKPRWAN